MSEPLTVDAAHYDLCIVGAGYAGLNAAFVATRYLPASARVLVLDKHDQAGGMWNDAYSYVRLHQSYQQFTVGNIAWSLGRERSYLATRDEVAAHLRYCFEVISKRFDVDARWGWECLGHTEAAGTVVVSARGSDGEVHTFTAERFIDASGFDVESLEPLPLSSRHVRCVAPQGLEDSGLLSSDHGEPVWVIGSGKTAMDTIVALVRANPARRIGMVTGAGTFFFSRDLVNATGLRRWTGGMRYTAIFAGAAKRFDGTNAAQVSAWCRARCGTSPLADPAPTHVLFALLSEAESSTVASGVDEVIRAHLVDVVDEASGPVMLLRNGDRHPIAAGSWVVNCTSHLGVRDVEHVPYVSSSGRVLSINSTSTAFGNTAVSAYFLSHLFLLDKLVDTQLYELDHYGLLRNAPEAALAVWSTLIMYNFSLVFERLPMKVFKDNELDLDRWYPIVRQLAGQLQFMHSHKRDRQHHRHALDTFSKHANVRCGPLARSAPPQRAYARQPQTSPSSPS